MSDEREYIMALTVRADGSISLEFDTLGKSAVREEIVRCRDCIHRKEATDGKAMCGHFSMEGTLCGGFSTEGSLVTLYPTVEWDGFCAWGKREDA